jgi:hypothetical protein
MGTNRVTDVTKGIVTYRNFAKAPKKEENYKLCSTQSAQRQNSSQARRIERNSINLRRFLFKIFRVIRFYQQIYISADCSFFYTGNRTCSYFAIRIVSLFQFPYS